MKTKLVWIIVVALLSACAADAYYTQKTQIASLRGEVDKLRNQQARLAVQAARLPVVVQTPVAAAEIAAAAPTPAAAAPPSESAADSEAAHAKRWEDDARASLTSVESAFAAEPTNEPWAAPTRVALRDRLTAVSRSMSSAVHEIDCRSSICRVEVVYRDADASRQFNEKAFTDPNDRAWNGPVVITPPQANPDGSVAAVMYLGREGTSLVKPGR
jgi:hypothetical protein